jgi:hypothetical protein
VLDWRILQPATVKQMTTANPARESRYLMVRPPSNCKVARLAITSSDSMSRHSYGASKTKHFRL